MRVQREAPLSCAAFPIQADLFGNQEQVRSNVCQQVHLQMLDSLLSDRAGWPAELKVFKIMVLQFCKKTEASFQT